MPRPLRPDIRDGRFHVMNRGIDHQPVFFDDTDRVEFGSRLADIFERFGIVTLAYCLMSNHYHLLLHCPDGSLSDGMQRLVSLFTRHVNDRVGRDGALFRGRFHSREITDDSYLLTATRYLHRNPLDLPGVTDIRDYRWSSHRTYLGLRAQPPWLRTADVLAQWGGDRQQFDEFVRNDLVPAAGRPVERRDIEALIAATALMFAERSEDGSGRLARSVALTWASEQAPDRALLQSLFEFDNRHALTAAISRGRHRLEADDDVRDILARAIDLCELGVSRLGSDPWRDDQRAARAAS